MFEGTTRPEVVDSVAKAQVAIFKIFLFLNLPGTRVPGAARNS